MFDLLSKQANAKCKQSALQVETALVHDQLAVWHGKGALHGGCLGHGAATFGWVGVVVAAHTLD